MPRSKCFYIEEQQAFEISDLAGYRIFFRNLKTFRTSHVKILLRNMHELLSSGSILKGIEAEYSLEISFLLQHFRSHSTF